MIPYQERYTCLAWFPINLSIQSTSQRSERETGEQEQPPIEVEVFVRIRTLLRIVVPGHVCFIVIGD